MKKNVFKNIHRKNCVFNYNAVKPIKHSLQFYNRLPAAIKVSLH